MRKKFLKKIQIDFDDMPIKHQLACEIFSSGETYGRIRNMTHNVELFDEDRDAAIRLLDKLYFPKTDPTGEYDNITFTDLNPSVVVEFD